MAGFTVKSFDSIVTDMVEYIVANSPQISDLTPGSVIRSFCEAAGLCLEELYVSTYLGFKRHLATIQEDLYEFDRKAGTKATVDVVFSRTGSSGTVAIPEGTTLKTDSGLKFLTTAAGEISDGETDSDDIEVEGEEVGVAYNVASSTVTTIADTIDGVETVDNALAATGGVDIESDYEYKKRFQAYIEGLGRSNIAGLLYGALSVDGITSATVVELFPPVSNVNVRLYVDDGSSGGVSAAKLLEVKDIIDGDGTDDNPGYRAAGINVDILAPTAVPTNVTVTITYVDTGIDTDQVETDINSAVTDYINTLGAGSDIIHAEIVAVVMSVYGVYDCVVTAPASNVSISDAQVGRVGTITVVPA